MAGTAPWPRPLPSRPTARLCSALRYYARSWWPLLHDEPLLLAFLLINFFCFNLLFYVNVQPLGWPTWLFVLSYPINWLLFYGGVFAFMALVAHHTPRWLPPRAALPKGELLLLVLYFYVLILPGGFLLSHGYPEVWPAPLVRDLMDGLDALHAAVAWSVGLPINELWLRFLRNFQFVFTFPALFLAVGNRLDDLGFRRPLSSGWINGVWPGLFLFGLVAAMAASRHWPTALVLALVGAGLAEEFAFRAALQTRLEIVLRDPIAAMVVQAVLFALVHLSGPQDDLVWGLVIALGGKAMVGFLLGYLYYRTRSLWPGVLLHAALDLPRFASML